MAIVKYEVKRRHLGDRDYFEGDIREAQASDVAHLVKAGVLVEAKAEAPPESKTKPKAR